MASRLTPTSRSQVDCVENTSRNGNPEENPRASISGRVRSAKIFLRPRGDFLSWAATIA